LAAGFHFLAHFIQGFMQNFFWVTGGLFIAGFGLLALIVSVVLIRCTLEARRESQKEKAVDEAKVAIGRALSSLRRWFTEWPEIEGLIDLMAYRLQVYHGIDGGELRRDWVAKLEKLQEERRKQQEQVWNRYARVARPVSSTEPVAAEAATDEPISPLNGSERPQLDQMGVSYHEESGQLTMPPPLAGERL
jgi:hypothetical protein